jgi:PAS domain S-box-containing protein
MALIKVSGEFLQTNEALSNFLGPSRTELMATTLQEVSAPDDNPSCGHLLDQFRKGSVRSGEFERRFLTKDGTQVWASLAISSLMDSDNRPNCFVLQLQNITEHKKAEDALRRSEAFSRAITDNAMDLIMVINTDHRWIYASALHFSMLGYEPREVLEKDMHAIVHPADQVAMERSTSTCSMATAARHWHFAFAIKMEGGGTSKPAVRYSGTRLAMWKASSS